MEQNNQQVPQASGQLSEEKIKFWKKRITNSGRVSSLFGILSLMAAALSLWFLMQLVRYVEVVGRAEEIGTGFWLNGLMAPIAFTALGIIMLILGRRLYKNIDDMYLHRYLVFLSALMSVLFAEALIQSMLGMRPGGALIYLLAPWYFFAALAAEKKLLAAGVIAQRRIEYKLGRAGWIILFGIAAASWILSYLTV